VSGSRADDGNLHPGVVSNRATGQYLEAIDKLDERVESIGVSAPGIS
jgi:FAD/FMN-containing dehydrogenase